MRFDARGLAAAFCLLAVSAAVQAQDAAALKSRHDSLRGALENNAFQRPLFLESTENNGELQGEVSARIAQPFSVVGPALRGIAAWCDILTLQPNVKRCRAAPAGDALVVDVGRKFDQPLRDTYRFEFAYSASANADYLQVVLIAAEGPLGTRRYRIALEAAPLDAGHSFLHLSYAYQTGIAARLAANAYLGTIGRDKNGFTVVDRDAAGHPRYIGGTRGAVERNAMRWYLAIDAWLGAQAGPAPARFEKRLRDWYDSAERYPAQLHELERDEYLAMKHREMQRQQSPESAVP